MAKYGKNYVEKNPFERNGKKVGTELVYKDGTRVILLNSHGKATKYLDEVKTGGRLTNEFTPKVNPKNSKQYTLRDIQRSYRSGYLDCAFDQSKHYKSKK